MDFAETVEHRDLRAAVGAIAARFGADYYARKAEARQPTTELWRALGEHGFIGINVPEEYGGGGAGLRELAIVCEESAAQGCPQLLLLVSSAISAEVIARYGTPEQRKEFLPRLATGEGKVVFAITEPDAGSNAHKITTTARRDGDDWLLSGQKVFISGVDEAQAVLIVARTEDAKTGNLKPALFVVPTDAAGLTYQQIEMAIASPEKQFMVFLDDVRLPADALVGDEDAGILQLFAGLNPERILAASFALGIGRFALDKAVEYAKGRTVFKQPIGAHQAIAHPLAQCKIELEQARLLTQKAAWLYDNGEDMAAGEAANMAKYAAGEAAVKIVDQAIQTHGGNGLTAEYGVAGLLAAVRATRIAPVSREMILNFVAMHTLGLPKSY
jgi:alkylation response protein AidB-like acyl-CoA dehydrogenase